MPSFASSLPTSLRTPAREVLAWNPLWRNARGLALVLPFLTLNFLHAQSETLPREGEPVSQSTQSESLKKGTNTIYSTFQGKEIKTLVYKPAHYRNGPILLLYHGASRDADGYLKSAKVLANRFSMLLAVTEYDRERFDVEDFQEGGVFHEKKLLDETDWTFQSIPPVVDKIRKLENAPNLPFYVVGHSAGAQFLSRLAGVYDLPAERIILVNPGAILFPTRGLNYPFGLGNLPESYASESALQKYLAKPLTIYIGTADTGSKQLPTEEEAFAQGANRLERSRNLYQFGKKLAEEKGWDFGWTILEAEGLDHRSPPMWEHRFVSEALFGPKYQEVLKTWDQSRPSLEMKATETAKP